MNQQSTKQKPINPHSNASRLSKMSYWWCRDLYKIGLSRPIKDEDVYETLGPHESERISKKFIKLWNQELKSSNPSTLRMFFNAYGWSVMIFGLLFSVCESLTRCIQPLLLGELLTYFADENRSKSSAYLYASGIVICSLVPVLTFHPYIFFIFETAMKIRVGCSRLVYDKVSWRTLQKKEIFFLFFYCAGINHCTYPYDLSYKNKKLMWSDDDMWSQNIYLKLNYVIFFSHALNYFQTYHNSDSPHDKVGARGWFEWKSD